MNNVEIASLVLPTYICTVANDNNSSNTFTNLNLKTILGTMYDKYDKFNIELVSITQYATEENLDFIVNPDDYNIFIQLSGLSFVNNNYSLLNNHNTNSTIIAAYQFVAFDEVYIKYFEKCSRTFIKDSNYIIDLTITYLQANLNIVDSNLRYDGNGDVDFGIYPEMVFMFNIYGIPNDKNNHNGSRMQIAN
jgi:hypothetical protein